MKNAQNKNRAVCFFFVFFPHHPPFFLLLLYPFLATGRANVSNEVSSPSASSTNKSTDIRRTRILKEWRTDSYGLSLFSFSFLKFFIFLLFWIIIFFSSSWPIPLLEEARLLSKRFFGESVRCKNHQYLCSHFELKTGRPTRSAFSLALCNSHL